ncbi:MAG: ABC transporter substrate-binding protein [Oscillospiraceae bacterium]|nr:ABC transporter substrate-binding protein [Oscillospiraceae bacterium]
MKRIGLLLLSAALLGSLLTGCQSDGTVTQSPTGSNTNTASGDSILDPENPTTISFYSYSLSYPTMKPGMEHLIAEFNETVGAEKGVIVESVVDASTTQFKADIAAGKQVNIVQHAFPTMDEDVQKLGFQAYEDIFPADELAEHFSHFNTNALSLGQIDGKTYGLAFTFSTPILYLNGALFEQAGLDPNDPPSTWEEVYDCAVAIKEKTGVDGFGLAPDNGWATFGILYSNGAEVLSEDRTEAMFASEEGIEAMEMWQNLYESGAHAVGLDKDLQEQFMAGNLGMHIQSTSLLSGFQSAADAAGWELYGAAMPAFEGKEAVPVNSGSSLMVRGSSAEEIAAVWEFVKYASSEEGYTIITEEIGYLPLRTDVVDDPNYLKGFVDSNPIIQTNLEQLERIQPCPIWPAANATELTTLFADMVTQIITTGADAETLMKRTQGEMNKLMGA